ncbi:Uncharacterised protein [Citrobacter youngae]|nr:Uncharacterised protein [Citrobacter youngae]
MSAMAEQKLKLEITMIDGKGGRREYSAEDGGRITFTHVLLTIFKCHCIYVNRQMAVFLFQET